MSSIAGNICQLGVALLLLSCGALKEPSRLSQDGKPGSSQTDIVDGYDWGDVSDATDDGINALETADDVVPFADMVSETELHELPTDALPATDAADRFGEDTVQEVAAAVCGNGICEEGETWAECFKDCPGACGNGDCEPGENADNCPWDCVAPCGDCICQPEEDAQTCPVDCGTCGDGICSLCDALNEDAQSCPADCAVPCGNCICEGGENPQNCPMDCGWCGDGFCSPCGPMEETPQSCPPDCT